jgi:hypothetical protein
VYNATGDEFPYSATVAHHNVTARSAPTYNSYATERLPKGTVVEVHQSIADGWVAIRPPEEAFDWIPAHAVEREADDPELGSVKEEFPAFIGSNIKKVENHLSQVSLKSGETVQIIAERNVPNGETEEKWYKIAPPAGEFRWVQAKFLTRQSPADLQTQEAEELAERETQYQEQNRVDPPGILAKLRQKNSRERAPELARDIDAIQRRLDERRPRTTESNIASDRFAENSDATARTTATIAPRYADAVARPGAKVSLSPEGFSATESSPIANAARDQVQVLRALEFKQELHNLEADLTQMVSQEPALWRLSPLKARAQMLIAQGPTPLDRGQARLTLEKISQFEATLPPGFQEPTSPSVLASNPTSPNAANLAGRLPMPEQFDGTGYLMPVKQAPAGVPPYHLVDPDGITRLYVTPAPGVNMERYIGKQVGIKGKRGYVETLGRQHVVAERVVDMNRHLR